MNCLAVLNMANQQQEILRAVFLCIIVVYLSCVDAQQCRGRLDISPSSNGTCTSAGITACQSTNITVGIWHNPPYAFLRHAEGIADKLMGDEGILTYVLNKTLHFCCPHCIDKMVSIEVIPSNYSTVFNTVRMVYPVIGPITAETMYGFPFTPLIKLPGAILLTISTSTPSQIARKLLTSVLDIWPLVAIAMLLAFVSGVLIWIMDTWFNVQEFPRPFIQGSLEGFWWAFVSMTTVGYGDLSPRSYHARLFAMIWILIGITVMALLTASLTSAITNVVAYKEPTLFGQKVGVISGHLYEEVLAVRKTSYVKVYGQEEISTMKSEFQHGVITAILLDSFTAKIYNDYFNDIEDLQITEIDKNAHDISYGVLFTNNDDYNYFNSFLRDNVFKIEQLVGRKFGQNTVKGTEQEASDEPIYSTESDMFLPALLAACLTIVMILVFGLAYEMMRRSRDQKIKPKRVDVDEMKKEIEKFKEDMNSDIDVLVSKWRSHLEAMPRLRRSRSTELDNIIPSST